MVTFVSNYTINKLYGTSQAQLMSSEPQISGKEAKPFLSVTLITRSLLSNEKVQP